MVCLSYLCTSGYPKYAYYYLGMKDYSASSNIASSLAKMCTFSKLT